MSNVPASCGLLVGLLCAMRLVAAAATPTTATAPADAARERLAARILTHTLEMHAKHLKSRDPLARAMAVICLARIDAPEVTDKLMEVMTRDARPIPRVCAWEALHARLRNLDAARQKKWFDAGVSMVLKKELCGDLRVLPVQGAFLAGPTAKNLRLFEFLYRTTSTKSPADMATLAAMRLALTRWHDARLVKMLLAGTSKLDTILRADFLLRGLASDVVQPMSFESKGSDGMVRGMQKAWAQWYKDSFEPAKKPAAPKYLIRTPCLLPAPERIADPHDPKWRRNLELDRFRLDGLEVALVVDSTGSMQNVLDWVKRDVGKLMRVFRMVSRRPRIAVVCYRDHNEEYVSKNTPLSGDVARLTRALRGERATGGRDEPEAVLDGLARAVKILKWSPRKTVHKTILLIGDAPPHFKTLPAIQKLLDAQVKKGFRVNCVKVNGSPSEFDTIARWGRGVSLSILFRQERYISNRVLLDTSLARPEDKDKGYQRILSEILTQALVSKGYEDQIASLVRVLLECAETPAAERRGQWPPFDYGHVPDPQDTDAARRGGL